MYRIEEIPLSMRWSCSPKLERAGRVPGATLMLTFVMIPNSMVPSRKNTGTTPVTSMIRFCRARKKFSLRAPFRLGAWMILSWSALLVVCSPALNAQEETPPLEKSEVGEGFQRHRIPLQFELAALYPFDLDGDGRMELVLLEADRGKSRQPPYYLQVFKQSVSGFKALASAAVQLPSRIRLAGVGWFGKRPGLAMLTTERLMIWPWVSGRFNSRQAFGLPMTSILQGSAGPLHTDVEWIRDLNGDGQSELLIPGFDGLTIVRQGEHGLARHAQLKMEGRSRIRNIFRRRVLRYDFPGIVFSDVDGNGWEDVTVYLNGLVRVFLLDDRSRNGWVAPAVEVDLQPPRPFDPKEPWDPPLYLIKGEDLNSDGWVDLVFAKSTAADSRVNSRTSILLHYGGKGTSPGPISFSKKPDQVYLSEGVALPFLLDIDHDGLTDLVMVNVEIGFWNIIKALITRKVSAEAAFYRMEPGGRYPSQPFTLESYDVTFSLGRFDHQPITAFGDFNGDGLPDLLLSVDAETIGIHWGRNGGVWDDDSDEEWQDHMPIHTRRVGVHDLNGDGRDDLLFLYNRADFRQMPAVDKSLTVLISRFGVKIPIQEGSRGNTTAAITPAPGEPSPPGPEGRTP